MTEPPPERPPAAAAVLDGKTERELALERELDESRRLVKQRETEVSAAEDRATHYKRALESPAKPKAKRGFSFARPLGNFRD